MKIFFTLVIPGIILAMPAHGDNNNNDVLPVQATTYILADNTDTDGIDRSDMESRTDTSDMDSEMDTSDMDTEMD